MWFEDSIGSDDESHGLLVSCFPIMQTCVLTVDFPEGVLARYKAMKELAPTTARARATVLYEGPYPTLLPSSLHARIASWKANPLEGL